MIDRKVFLEYTRKMTLQKHCISRVHISRVVRGKAHTVTNASIGNLEPKDQNKEVAIAKEVPFSKSLKEKKFTTQSADSQKVLAHMLATELKDPKFCNFACESFSRLAKGTVSVHLFFGSYEVPQKRIYEQGSSSSVTENETGEIYNHIICSLCDKDGNVIGGIMYPAYMEERYGDSGRYDFFTK